MDQPRFIDTQRILLLDGDLPNPQRFLRPEVFRAARLRREGGDGRSSLFAYTCSTKLVTPTTLRDKAQKGENLYHGDPRSNRSQVYS